MATRPEPTIIGNCDSWSFIVGKKPAGESPTYCILGELPGCNNIFIHSLPTICTIATMNNLWATCGSAVHGTAVSRIMNPDLLNMQISAEQGSVFYRK